MNFIIDYQSTIKCLRATGNYSEIARRMSLRQQELGMKGQTTQGWVSRLVAGGIEDPGFKRFSLLKEVLETFRDPRTNSVGQAVAVAPISSDRRDGYEGRV